MEPEPINKATAMQIQQLMKDEKWEAVLKFYAYKINLLKDEKITGTNDFETLKNLHTQQGKIDGLTEFFDQMERKAFD